MMVMMLSLIHILGTTMLVVTHERDLVNRFSKRVVTIMNGTIIRDEQDGVYGL